MVLEEFKELKKLKLTDENLKLIDEKLAKLLDDEDKEWEKQDEKQKQDEKKNNRPENLSKFLTGGFPARKPTALQEQVAAKAGATMEYLPPIIEDREHIMEKAEPNVDLKSNETIVGTSTTMGVDNRPGTEPSDLFKPLEE